MGNGLQRFAGAFRKQRQVEVGIGIGGIQFQRTVVVVRRVLHAALFVVKIPEVEFRQRIARVGDHRLHVMLFGLCEILLAIEDRSEVHQRSGGGGIQFQRLPVGFDGQFDRGAGLFHLQAFLEPGFRFAHAVLSSLAIRKLREAAQFGGVEIEQDLPGERLHRLTRNTDRDLLAVGDDAEFRERLLDPAELAAQRFHGSRDLGRRDAVFTQLGDRLDGDQIGEGIGFGREDQLLPLPAPELSLGDPELPADIRPGVFLPRAFLDHGNILAGGAGSTAIIDFISKST